MNHIEHAVVENKETSNTFKIESVLDAAWNVHIHMYSIECRHGTKVPWAEPLRPLYSIHLCRKDDKRDNKDDQNGQNLEKERSVGLQIVQGIRQRIEGQTNVGLGVIDIVFHACDQVSVFRHHNGQLVKDGSQFHNVGFYLGHGIGAFS